MKRRCIFLDRDGVINRKAPEGDYILTWEDFHFLPNITDWIRLFNTLGYLVIVITNQRAVARGLMTVEQLEEMHERMKAELGRRGAIIDDVFYCPHAENACDCRKPRPGMILAAQRKWDMDLENSVFIGDSQRDRQLAERCNLTFIEVDEGRILQTEHRF